nr:reverse transcriptase domain-containing protein [Tanacetum cinerariifolium]
MDECLALADIGVSRNLMPLSAWNKLSLPELPPTCMTLKLADRLISCSVRVAEDVFVKVGTFHFPANFVVVDFDADPRVPLILMRYFLKTERALIDVFEGELTLFVGKEAITFNLDQNSRYSANYNDMMASLIDVIDMACEEYSQEVLDFCDVITSGNPTPYYDPIVSTSSPTLTPFGDNDFLLEEFDAFLALEDDPTSPKVDQSDFDPKGDIFLLEEFFNDDPSLTPPNQGNYLPQVRKELKFCEAKTYPFSIKEIICLKFERNLKFVKPKTDKSLIDEPPIIELKDLPPHLEYAFLEGDDKLPVIISKDLSVEEKTALITFLKSQKSCADPTLLNDFEMAAEGNDDPPVPDLQTMKELCQPSLNGRNSCQIHGLPGDDANKHLDKFLHVTQSIKVNGVTDDALHLHRDTINAVASGTFMQRRPKECYDLIENITAHHNDWDTSTQRSESSSSITFSSDLEIIALKAKMAEINKNLMRVLQVNQQVKAVTPNCETLVVLILIMIV